ncbi:MAG: hypothetical protein JWL71_1120 [Acidobacteria bacterium]|nr:hypothetical protein [Acidobacteriota bacterium]
MASEHERNGPSGAQLDAAIEGARDMVEANRHVDETHGPTDRGGGGGVQGAGGTSQGGSNSPAGTDDAVDPSVETGGPRGAGYPPSRTSGGRLDPDGDPRGVEPDEAIKRETAVFEPGTHGRKPAAAETDDSV